MKWLILGAAAAVAAAVLFLFDPARSGFYPICLFHKMTGLLCPGCGGLRASHQLLHGHVAAAFRLNALLVVSVPILAWFGASWAIRRFRGQPNRVSFRPLWFWLAIVVVILFGIARNIF